MTSAERVMRAASHQEPDRVPFVLPATMHGARQLGLSLPEFFAHSRTVAEGWMRMHALLETDAVLGMFYAAQEHEAWGGEVRFFDDGPPNAGAPLVDRIEDVLGLEPPRVEDCPKLRQVLEAIRFVAGRLSPVPVLGAVVSPFSVPIMQLGFERYLEVLLHRRDLFDHLMRINTAFAIEWGRAQAAAGAAMLVYFDPVASPDIVPVEMYRELGQPIARTVIASWPVGALIALASGRVLPVLDDLLAAGAIGVSASGLEDLAEAKRRARGRATVVGNLNGVQMRRWTDADAEREVKRAIAAAGPGGGFILCEHHGEIPWQVPESVLQAVAESVRQWGRYPLEWVDAG
jgi:uroporphyrinogen decarboxylase